MSAVQIRPGVPAVGEMADDDWMLALDMYEPPEDVGNEPETITFVEMVGESARAIEVQPVGGDGFPAWFPRRYITTNMKRVGDQGHVSMPHWLWRAKISDGFEWVEKLAAL